MRFIFYKTDASFDYGDFDYHTEDEHGIEIDVVDNKPIMNSLDGIGNFTYLTRKYTQETLANELRTHIEDIELYKDVMAVTFINYTTIKKVLKLLERKEENEITRNHWHFRRSALSL